MIFKRIDENSFHEWGQFLEEQNCNNVFYSPEFYIATKNSLINKPFAYCLYDNDKIVALIVGVIQSNFSFPLNLFTTRAIIYGQPVAKSSHYLNDLLSGYNKAIKNRAIYSEIRNLELTNERTIDLYAKYGFKYQPHLDIIIELNAGQEEIKQRISKNKRRNIVKSTNKGVKLVKIETLSEYEIVIDLISQTYKRIKLPLPNRHFFISMFNELQPSGTLKVFAAKLNNSIIAGRIELCYKNIIYDWYAGSNEHYNSFYANDFIIYNVILWGNANGYSHFDFGGAGKPGIPYGVREHKMKFGGKLLEYGRFNKTYRPLIYSFAKLGLSFFKLFR